MFCQGCVKQEEKTKYKGDGKLVFLEKPGFLGSSGWKIIFKEFSLSETYNATYSFTGLPNVKNLEYYIPYLYIPPSLTGSMFENATLQMVLYSERKEISKFNAQMKNWICSGSSLTYGEYTVGDGRKKSFYSQEMYISSDSKKQYKLEVRYTPPDSIGIKENGYFYLKIGGSK